MTEPSNTVSGTALKCNVYVVTSKDAPGYPRGDCFKCGEPLREHEIRVSALVPPGSTAYVIDEEALRV
jgi:hypothetical protein